MMVCAKTEAGQSRQFIAAIIANLGTLSYGITVGWTSPMTPRLQSPDSPLGPEQTMSDEEVSWLTAVLCAGGIFGTLLLSFIGEKMGRKTTGLLIAVPYASCWLLTMFASSPVQLFLGRFLGGIAGAGSLFLTPLYVTEISTDNIRGMLGSLLVLTLNTGILLAYIFGTILSYDVFAGCALLILSSYALAFLFLPESPVYLLRRNRPIDASRALAWLRANDEASIELELERLQARAKDISFSARSVGLHDLFRDRPTTKGFVIVLGLFIGQQLSGIFAMVSYTETIFKISGSSLTPEAAAITVAAIQLLGSYLSTWLMERTGRRLLLIASCAGMCGSHYVLGGFCFLQSHRYDVSSFNWLPIVALSLFLIVYNLGMGPIPYILGSEILPRDVASLALTISLISTWTIAFILVKTFSDLMTLLGTYGCFFLLGTFCMCNLVFTLLLVPETKGRSLECILDELNGLPGDFEKTKQSVSTIHQPKEEFLQRQQP